MSKQDQQAGSLTAAPTDGERPEGVESAAELFGKILEADQRRPPWPQTASGSKIATHNTFGGETTSDSK